MVCWALVNAAGELVHGEGTRVTGGPRLSEVAKDAQAIVLYRPGTPPLYALGGVDLLYTTDVALSGATSQAWGVLPPEGSRTWLWPDGRLVGIGRTVEDVLLAEKIVVEAGTRRS